MISAGKVTPERPGFGLTVTEGQEAPVCVRLDIVAIWVREVRREPIAGLCLPAREDMFT